MNRPILIVCSLVCLMTLMTGCAPGMRTLRPGATGKVVDIGGSPIAGATITVEGPLQYSSGAYHSNRHTGHAETVTAADGHFTIPAQQVFGKSLGSTPEAEIETSRLNIEKQGYSKHSELFNTDVTADVGTITLQLRK